jgi:hypothetical protein
MSIEEIEIVIEIVCANLPGEEWGGHSPLHLGIQKDDQIIETASAGSKRVVFRPVLRARSNIDGSANFIGAFAHGSRTERFIYLVWGHRPWEATGEDGRAHQASLESHQVGESFASDPSSDCNVRRKAKSGPDFLSMISNLQSMS